MSDLNPTANPDVGVTKKATRGYAMYVFWVMFSISFLNYLDRYVLSGAANVIARELGFGFAGIGGIASSFLIFYLLFTIPLGIVADRTKRKNVVAISVAIWSLATAFTAFANSLLTLVISRTVLGIGEAGYFPAGTALMSDYFSRSRRSRIMSWWSIGQLIGILVGFVIGGVLAGIGKWRLAFIFTGIPGLLLAFLAWRLREPRRNEADEEEIALYPYTLGQVAEIEEPHQAIHISSNVFSQFGMLLRIKTLVVLIIMQIFAFFVLGVNLVFLPTYLQQLDIFGLSSGQAGLYSGAVIVMAGIVGTVLGGYMADWLNRRHQGARVLVCGIGFLLSAPSFALAITTHNFKVFSVFFIVTTILLTLYTGPSTAATQDVVPAILRASAVAVSLFLAHLLGDAIAPTLVGVLASAFDPTHGQHFAHNVGGQDLARALLFTCTPALLIAGLVGIFGARWMRADVATAQEADKLGLTSA
jgi:MFS family permease